MKTSLRKELPLILVVLAPFVYLAYIWGELPETVPLHWNIKGEVDRYGSKMELLLLPFLLPTLVYVLFLIIPKIDPKKKIDASSSKYQTLRTLLTVFMSILAMMIIYTARNESFENPNYIILAIGILFLILGNYFKTLKANYFIGIRTPWTLENERVWKDTHKLGGMMWFVGGLIIAISSIALNESLNAMIFIIITVVISVVPIVYSYVRFRHLSKQAAQDG